MAKRAPNEIVDEELDDDEGLIDAPVDDTDPAPDGDDTPAADGDGEGRTIDPELPEEPAEGEEGEELEKPAEGEEGEKLPELTDEEAGAEVDPAAAAVDDEGEPFEALDGARVFKGAGVFIPEGEPLERLRTSLGMAARGSEEWTRERTELAEQVRELREVRGAEAEVAADVLELVFKDFAAMDEDALYEWAVQFKANEARLRTDIREKLLDRKEKALERRASRRDPAEVERERTAAVEQVQSTIAATLETLYQRPELKNLTKEDKVKLLARSNERASQLAVQAPDDSMIQFGIKKGELYLNAQQIYEWALDRAEVRDSAKLARGVDVVNARKLGKGKLGNAPGGARGARSAAPVEEERRRPQTREEWLAWVDSSE
jgi:hypothetical protein